MHSPLPDDWALVASGVDNHIALVEFDHQTGRSGQVSGPPSNHRPSPPIRFRVKPPRVDVSCDDPKVLDKYTQRIDKACAKKAAPLIDVVDVPLAALSSVFYIISVLI